MGSMKKIKTFKSFNEALSDKLKGKSEDDILNSMKNMNALQISKLVKRYKLDMKYMPSDDEIEKATTDEMKRLNILPSIKYVDIIDSLYDEVKNNYDVKKLVSPHWYIIDNDIGEYLFVINANDNKTYLIGIAKSYENEETNFFIDDLKNYDYYTIDELKKSIKKILSK